MDFTAIFKAIGEVFGLINNWMGHKNTPEMKKAEQQQKEVDRQNEIEKALKEKDIEKLRRLLSQ
ncbi:MAG: hypothetical protein EBU90_03475 [Proteobacteria bacterium]|nr:hypothetical protein [Pseudomonadota bacterium]NBP13386.1 hypothetical protein [bacterium]